MLNKQLSFHSEGPGFITNPSLLIILHNRRYDRIRKGRGYLNCQSGRVIFCQSGRFTFCQSGGVQYRKGPVLASPEGSYFADPEVSKFGGVLFVANPEGSQFGGVLFLPIRKGFILPIRRGPNSEESCFLPIRIFFTSAIAGILTCT